MKRFAAAFALVLSFGLLITACDSGLTGPEATNPSDGEVETANHGATGIIEATATYRTVATKAAEKNGFSRAGEKIGTLTVIDDGSALTVTGEASGLESNEDERYVSLFYDKASPAQGARACEPGRNVGIGTDHPLSLTLLQMIIGPGTNSTTIPPGPAHAAWNVDGNGDATLGPSGTQQYVSADRIGTVSIRDVTVTGPIGPGTGPEAVVACGVVTHAPAGGPPSGN